MKTDQDPTTEAEEASSTTRPAPRQRSGLIPNFAELSKARLNTMVLGTTAVGFALAAPDLPAMKLFWTLVGTALTAASAGMLNQLAEIRRDGLMRRTRERPLPAGLVSPKIVFVIGVLLAYAGVTALTLKVNGLSASLALINVLLYVLVYTPLKPRTTLNTLVGAICGAIPPMIGWVAATGQLDGGAWLLGMLLFVWQLPHFFALAMMYREDYERGGFAMLPVVDDRGEITVQVILVTSLILIPVGLGATLIGLTGWLSAGAAILLGLMMSGLALMLYIRRTPVYAKRVFLGSLAYLPLMLGAMVIDSQPTEGEIELPEELTAPTDNVHENLLP
jgi:protoheme IX farnesyltransferase